MKWQIKPRIALPIAAAVVFTFESWGISKPSMWADEVATVAAANRPIGGLWVMLHHIDAVHATYYALIHFYGGIFGFSPMSLRLLSAAAVTAAVILLYPLGKRLYGAKTAWIAVLIGAVLPRLTWAATEARSYALDALMGVVATLLLLRALDAPRNPRAGRLRWVLYALTLTAGTYLFLYVLLLGLSHGVWVWLKKRHEFNRWLLSFAAAALACTYLLILANDEKHQIAWLPSVGQQTIPEVFEGQYFLGNPALAYLCVGLILAALVGGVALRYSRTERNATVLLGLCVVLPTSLTLAYSLLRKSIYDTRYFSFSAPLLAILLAWAVTRIFSRGAAIVALAVLVALSLQSYSLFRQPESKSTNWAALASLVSAKASPHDGILYADFLDRSPSLSRIHIGYPKAFSRLNDLTLALPFTKSHGLFDERVLPEASVGKWQSLDRVLVLGGDRYAVAEARLKDDLKRQGFSLLRANRYEANTLLTFVQNRKR